ncbi:MAG: hypothetical protein HYY93_01150 [Planctomycetes bacterium]|nr:hypothetical protein [Planctomycetota bacterium]
MTVRRLCLLALCLVALPSRSLPQSPPPAPAGVAAFDTPNDKGESVSVTWNPVAGEKENSVVYEVRISDRAEGPFTKAAEVKAGEGWKDEAPDLFWYFDSNKGVHHARIDPSEALPPTEKAKLQKVNEAIKEAGRPGGDASLIPGLNQEQRELEESIGQENRQIRGRAHYYQIVAKTKDGEAASPPVAATAGGNYFNTVKTPHLLLTLFLCGGIIGFIIVARRGKELFLRKIPGLAALDEAIGRATEMGKPLYYLTGRLGLSDNEKSVSTIAAMIVLGKVAERVATYDCALKVPHTDPVVAGVCQEMTRESYIRAGRPDAFKEDINPYISTDQFSYTAAVTAMISREKPAAIMYFGYYYAESLLLAETGNSVGAIQVGATDADHQLPFFFAACDYTLIGEELYAAAAYVSREPILLGTLRGQDLGKGFLILVAIVGALSATAVALGPETFGPLHYFVDFFKTPFAG